MILDQSTVERFWLRVDKTGGCWKWIGKSRHTFGYGLFKIKSAKQMQYAHRISWVIANGAVPHGLCVLHHCDVPECVNPSHLFLGTKKDNTLDMRLKGRNRKLGQPGQCLNGHPFPENLFPGGRGCRICNGWSARKRTTLPTTQRNAGGNSRESAGRLMGSR